MKVLVIEDSKMIAGIISNCMKSYRYEMTLKTSTGISPYSIDFNKFEFVIINLNIDQVASGNFVEKIKNINPKINIIGINNKGTWQDKVGFLNTGGDDVLDYPFPMQELFARIQAILRRPGQSSHPKIEVADIEIDPTKRIVKKRDKSILLNKMEFNILEYMARNKNRPITRNELTDHVWDYRKSTASNTVDVHMSKLRKNIGDEKLIETVHGIGYMLCDSQGNQSEGNKNVKTDFSYHKNDQVKKTVERSLRNLNRK